MFSLAFLHIITGIMLFQLDSSRNTHKICSEQSSPTSVVMNTDGNRQDSQQTKPCLNQLLVAVLEVVRKERIVNGFKPFVLMAGHLCQTLFGDIGGDYGLSAVAPSIFRYALSYSKVYPSSDSVMIPQNTSFM